MISTTSATVASALVGARDASNAVLTGEMGTISCLAYDIIGPVIEKLEYAKNAEDVSTDGAIDAVKILQDKVLDLRIQESLNDFLYGQKGGNALTNMSEDERTAFVAKYVQPVIDKIEKVLSI